MFLSEALKEHNQQMEISEARCNICLLSEEAAGGKAKERGNLNLTRVFPPL